MQTSELRDRLAAAFYDQVTNRTLGGRYSSERPVLDWTSAYELADIALGVVEDRRDTGLSGSSKEKESPYDQAVDECPECQAKPGEQCIVMEAIMHGFLDGTPPCPRDA